MRGDGNVEPFPESVLSLQGQLQVEGRSRPRSVVLIIVSIASNIRFDTYEDTP